MTCSAEDLRQKLEKFRSTMEISMDTTLASGRGQMQEGPRWQNGERENKAYESMEVIVDEVYSWFQSRGRRGRAG